MSSATSSYPARPSAASIESAPAPKKSKIKWAALQDKIFVETLLTAQANGNQPNGSFKPVVWTQWATALQHTTNPKNHSQCTSKYFAVRTIRGLKKMCAGWFTKKSICCPDSTMGYSTRQTCLCPCNLCLHSGAGLGTNRHFDSSVPSLVSELVQTPCRCAEHLHRVYDVSTSFLSKIMPAKTCCQCFVRLTFGFGLRPVGGAEFSDRTDEATFHHRLGLGCFLFVVLQGTIGVLAYYTPGGSERHWSRYIHIFVGVGLAILSYSTVYNGFHEWDIASDAGTKVFSLGIRSIYWILLTVPVAAYLYGSYRRITARRPENYFGDQKTFRRLQELESQTELRL